MDLTFTAAQEAFRAELRDFIAGALRPELAAKVASGAALDKADYEEWQGALNARGWLAQHWPVAYGGPDWGPVERHLFDLECGLAHAPRLVPFGLSMLGPVLIAFGSEAQKAHWLPRILDGTDWWCQGYSEPGAGSDLAGLKTSARREGDVYVVNGQKTWTTLGHFADMIFCLVRTSTEGKPQEGISFLLIDMKTPGIELRPIVTIEGGHEVNEIFFTDVRVPVENLVGEENKGWTYAKYLLTYERSSIAQIGAAQAALARLKRVAARRWKAGRPLLDDPLFAARLARLEIKLDNMITTNLRMLAEAEGGAAAGAESSILKLLGSEVDQELTDLLRRAVGPHAQADWPGSDAPGFNGPAAGPDEAVHAAASYFNHRKVTIYGGSTEVQRGIIAKAMLGL